MNAWTWRRPGAVQTVPLAGTLLVLAVSARAQVEDGEAEAAPSGAPAVDVAPAPADPAAARPARRSSRGASAAASPTRRHRPAVQPVEPARPPASQPAIAAPDQDGLRALQVEVDGLRQARDAGGLQQLCDARRPQQLITDRALYTTWQALCRGWVGLARHDTASARLACQQVATLTAGVSPALRPSTRGWVLEAQLCLGEAAELDYRGEETCLARLGDRGRARAEALGVAALREQATEAYLAVLREDRGELGLRALLRAVALSDHFYRHVTSTPPSLRGVHLGPPRRGLALSESPLLEAALAPEHSALRRKILLSYRKLARRARDQHAPDTLVQEIEQALRSFEDYQPGVQASLRAPWPPRQGERAGIVSVERDETGFLLTLEGGQQQRLSTDQAVPRLRQLLAPLGAGAWAPRAALELAELGDSHSAEALLEALQLDDDPELQVAAAHGLGRLGKAAHVEPLLEALARAQRADPRPLFDRPEHAAFGLPERVLEALIEIGQRDPLAVEGLLARPELPPREAAYVLWACRQKNLYNVYARMREQRDPVVKAYGLMALVDLQGEAVRWALADEPGDDPLLRCVRRHLRAELED